MRLSLSTLQEIFQNRAQSWLAPRNGRFEDQQSTHNNSPRVIQSLTQKFTARVSGGADTGVFVDGLGGQYSTLAILKFRDFVKINNDYGGTFDTNGKFKPKVICR